MGLQELRIRKQSVASLAVGAGIVTQNMPGNSAPPITALCHV